MQQAGVDSDVYGHPVLILATHVAKNGLKCVRAAVVNLCSPLLVPAAVTDGNRSRSHPAADIALPANGLIPFSLSGQRL